MVKSNTSIVLEEEGNVHTSGFHSTQIPIGYYQSLLWIPRFLEK